MTKEAQRALLFSTRVFIEEHNKKDPYWFEGIVGADGTVEASFHSHLRSLIRRYGKSEEEVYGEMPETASPIYWLMERTGCIPVYRQGYLAPPPPAKLTDEQRFVIDILSQAKMTQNIPLAAF